MADRRREQVEQSNIIRPTFMGLSNALIGEGDNQLVPLGDGNVRLGKFVLTSKGINAEGVSTEAEWEEVGNVLRRIEGSIQWLIGDWCVYAERQWGKTYEMIAEKTGYSKKTLYEYANVARHVDFSIRMENLSFGHHQAVAGLSSDEQVRWLAWAAENKVPISQMRKDIQQYLGTATPILPRLIPEQTEKILNRLRTVEEFDSIDPGSFNRWMDDIEEVRAFLDRFERIARERLVR